MKYYSVLKFLVKWDIKIILFWKNNTLVIYIGWRKSFVTLEKYNNSLRESNLIEKYSLDEKKIRPALQVPLSKFKKTYRLPLASPVLDNIRHRGDSTLFKIDWPNNNSFDADEIFLKIIWYRIGPTNLYPRISLFDQNKNQI